MRRYQSFGDLPLGAPRRVVAIGTFDGVHVGHQAVIRQAIGRAAERGLPSMVMTFEPQPISVLRPELRPGVLTHISLKSQLIERLGVDQLLVVPFTKAYSGLTDSEFRKITAWVRKNTLQRFGPVRQVRPEHVFEIAFEGIFESPRHKSGIALRFPRMARWRHDKPVQEANSLDDLHALLSQYAGLHLPPHRIPR